MGHDGSAPPLPIVAAIDVLFLLTLAHHFILWWSYPGLSARLLGLLAIFVVVNDWLTTRSSYALYSARIFGLDLTIILILNGLPHALSRGWSGSGPAMFWILLCLCEVCYAGWDLAVARRAPEPAARHLDKWTSASLFAAALYGFAAGAYVSEQDRSLLVIATGLAGAYAMGMLVVWNLQRRQLKRQNGQPFLSEN